jgi:hypothetical protein
MKPDFQNVGNGSRAVNPEIAGSFHPAALLTGAGCRWRV